MAVSREAMQMQAAQDRMRGGRIVHGVGVGVEVVGAGVVAYEAARYFGILDWITKVGLPFLGQFTSFLIPGALGLLTFIAGGFIANTGSRRMAEAAASMPVAAAS